jgi:ubiquinone/menaquinone biosynthesis C-methylase UbiE
VHEAAEDERYTIACAHVRIAVAEMPEENGKCSSSGQPASHLRQMKDKMGLGQVRKKVNRLGVHVRDRVQTFEPFARQQAYVRVNEKLVDRILKRLPGRKGYQLLDIAAGTGLMTRVAHLRARVIGAEVASVLLDIDLPALREARKELPPGAVKGYVCASTDRLPFTEAFDVALFANSLHLLDDQAKVNALAETRRVLHSGGVLAVNSAFYEGASPDESRPFYGRWIRRSIAEINQAMPLRKKSDRAQATRSLSASGYTELIACAGFQILEVRERRVLLSQAAVRAISSYKDFAMGALRATEEDANAASRALQASVQPTFRDLQMKYLPRKWLEIIAVKP